MSLLLNYLQQTNESDSFYKTSILCYDFYLFIAKHLQMTCQKTEYCIILETFLYKIIFWNLTHFPLNCLIPIQCFKFFSEKFTEIGSFSTSETILDYLLLFLVFINEFLEKFKIMNQNYNFLNFFKYINEATSNIISFIKKNNSIYSYSKEYYFISVFFTDIENLKEIQTYCNEIIDFNEVVGNLPIKKKFIIICEMIEEWHSNECIILGLKFLKQLLKFEHYSFI